MLIIDDMEERHEGLTLQHNVKFDTIDSAYTYDEAIQLLGKHRYDYVTFDHDLNDFENGQERTGASIARWMANEDIICKAACVHSQNSQGALNILSILKSGEVSETVPEYRPFTWGRVWYDDED
jgi:hypothetical protein